ncbi:hypothetical protein J1605_009113 [Eschrichtius robustus]|uniref:TBC1 domain family member 14 n=1 Tax=Eschrichtius robustus TaxID=9764 RepID=A0AB34GTI8_ESCRO|nr:hypothetical protein J1605_009113 [Eschrichtius robustus]
MVFFLVFPWTKMTDGNLSTTTNGVALMGILDGRPGNHVQNLQHLNLKAPRSLSLSEYGPKLKLGALEDRHSLKSVDSGIPTLEIGNPEPVPCSVVHVKRKQSESEIIPERACQSACPLPSYAPPAPTSAEREQSVRKSSTFPRTGYDSVKLYSPTSKTLNRSDNVSVCSVSSLGTELSATLSVSNEDILDLVVTSSSSAIVTLENDDDPQFTDVTLSSIKETRDLRQQDCVDETEEGRKLKILGPFSNFFTRALYADNLSLLGQAEGAGEGDIGVSNSSLSWHTPGLAFLGAPGRVPCAPAQPCSFVRVPALGLLLSCVLSLHCRHTRPHLCQDQAMRPTPRGALSPGAEPGMLASLCLTLSPVQPFLQPPFCALVFPFNKCFVFAS